MVNPRSTRVKIPSIACFPVIVSTRSHFPPSQLRSTDLLLLYTDDELLILVTHQKSSDSLAVKVFSRFTLLLPSHGEGSAFKPTAGSGFS